MLVNLLFSLVVFGTIVAIVLLVGLFYKRMLIPVEMVNAGQTDNHTSACATSSSAISAFVSPFESFYHNGKKVNPKDYIIRKVDGDCMLARNISAGDLVFIENHNKDINTLSIGDILFIKYKKEGMVEYGYKLREYRGFDAHKQQIQTLYYTREGKGKESSHAVKSVEGVVKMKFTT